MIEDSMNTILQAENKADEIIRQARSTAEDIARSTKVQIDELKAKAQADSDNYSNQTEQKNEEDGKELIEKSRIASEEKAKALEDDAASKEDAAVQAVIDKVLGGN